MSATDRHQPSEAAGATARRLSRPFLFPNCAGFVRGPRGRWLSYPGTEDRRCTMKIRSLSLAALVLAGIVAGAATAAALAATPTTDEARMEACFRAHGKLMMKPALMNANDCWRAHNYLMER